MTVTAKLVRQVTLVTFMNDSIPSLAPLNSPAIDMIIPVTHERKPRHMQYHATTELGLGRIFSFQGATSSEQQPEPRQRWALPGTDFQGHCLPCELCVEDLDMDGQGDLSS